MSFWLTFFLLISCYCVTCSNAKRPCSGFRGATLDVRGVIGETISLTCNISTNCTRGLWRYENTINHMWLLPEKHLIDFNSSQGVNILHIHNINESVKGFYTCICERNWTTPTAQACFNLSVHVVHCPICVQINGEEHVLEKCSVRGAVEMVDVEVNAKITIKCNGKGTRETNCSQILEKPLSFTVKSSHHLCSLSCKPKIESMEHEVMIILNVMDNTISTTTATPRTTISTETTPEITTDSSVIFSSSSSKDHSTSTERKPSTITQNRSATSLTSKFNIKPTCQTVTTKTITHLGDGKSSTDTHLPTTATVNVSYGNSSPTEESPMENIFSQKPVIVAFCVIFVLVVIILLLCVHITFYKIGIRSCKDKEEWVNPLYESADNGTQFPIAIPDEGNPYDTVSSQRQVADFSSAVSTTNIVHQINPDLRSYNEIPMVQVGTSQNAAVRLLDHTVTDSNVGSMKLKKVEKSPTKTETLNLPKADDISPPPASPHLYEMLND